MKICMMTNTYTPHVGGVARSVQSFVEDLRGRGHEVLVVAPTFPQTDLERPHPGRDVVRVPAIQQFNGSDFSVSLPLDESVDETLADFGPDIFHSHHPFLLGDSALRLAAEMNRPVVFTHHTLYEQYTHYVPFDSPTLKHFVTELSTKYSNLCDAVIAPSESIARLIQKRGVTVPVEVIPTGIDVQAFANGDGQRFRQHHGLGTDTFVIGHLGRLAHEKNLCYLARSVSLFLKQVPEASFLVVGAGPAGNEIRETLDREGVGDRLVLAGKKTGPDLHDAYQAMDVFAFSSHSETQGMVLAEAMAAGLPVVAMDASGVREVVRDAVNGCLLPANANEAAFAERLNQLHADVNLRRQFHKGALQTAPEFSRANSASKLLAFYKRVLRQSRRERGKEETDAWDALLNRIEIEWELLSGKAQSVITALFGEENERDIEKSDRPA